MQNIGAYRLLGRLGAGGMGEVYLARSERGRTVAVKVVREELAEQEEFRNRFRQEVAAARRVGGAWTAPVLDADTDADIPWVATGYVAGPSLQQVVSHDYGALPERSVRILAGGLAHALKDIHAAGIIHRDLKPSNVLITIDGPRVIDFGIARALETVTDGGLTRTGALVGSPGFMAPEQVRGDRITPACDVFCLGSVLAYAASGQLPFRTTNSGVHALMYRIAEEPPELTELPEGLQELVRDCLHKQPGDRPTLDEILERTGVDDTLGDTGRTRDPWLPGALVAQLARHAAKLLDTENPERTARPPSPAPPPPGTPAAASLNHLPTVISHETPATPPPAPAPAPAPQYGYPHPSQPQPLPQQPTYGYPPGGWVRTPPYGPPPPEPPRRNRSTPALIVVALVVALGAGGSVYALMNGKDKPSGRADDKVSATSATSPAASDPSPPSSPSPPSQEAPSTQEESPRSAAGDIPTTFLGTWEGAIDNANGHHPRSITLQQGSSGDTVFSLTADGYQKDGAPYHCVFQGQLESATSSTVRIGPTDPTTAQPSGACNPGEPSTITLTPGGELKRVMSGGEAPVTYDRTG
ncbi:serine/threonine-protein kinase [Streptomyces endophyticus]|uniref:Protein kinase n=1 Tax=Streptomyces endophyticus TaxID=714166 RepID=A0ABU6FK98_9ACTN|nr:protein kinase [Streptomyces endophyticus]MEB8344027.1 protein kinase [Streptomyces endophyticus]